MSSTQTASEPYPSSPFYGPLNESKHEIRILTIFPGPPTARIQCQLNVVSLLPKNKPKFWAASWTWGDKKQTHEIALHGETFGVSKNLFEMLLKLRHAQRTLTYWIDAICINQTFTPEKSQQVSAMGEVYSAAEAMVVWLGNAADDSDEVFRVYQKYEKLLAAPMGIYRIPEAEFTDRFKLAAARFGARPWFSRVWIIQEFAVSNLVLFKCGDKAVKIAGFDQLLRKGEESYFPQSPGLEPDYMTRVKQIATYSALWQTRRTTQRKYKPHEQPSYSTASQNLLMQSYSESSDVNPNRLELLHLLAKYRLFGVTEPEDKVYALYCLARIGGEPIAGSPLKPDYGLPTEVVFQKAAFQIIAMTGNLDVFSFLLPRSRPPRKGLEPLRLSSWAPDWRLRPRHRSHWLIMATRHWPGKHTSPRQRQFTRMSTD